jgi:hypothetical protein
VATILTVLLVIAAWLKPSPNGYGTHQQLGLPGCSMMVLFGIRCPGCGMTTSWAHTLDGNLTAGLRTNLSGVLFCLSAIAFAPLLAWTSWRGKTWHWLRSGVLPVGVLIAILSISMVEWVIRLAAS